MSETLTFEHDDKFNRLEFAKRLTESITKFHGYYEDSYVLSLNARFGSGKTTFLKMWKNYLETAPLDYKVIYLNAWETDFDTEPLISILSTLISEIKTGTASRKLKDAATYFLGSTVLTTNSILNFVSGVNVKEIAERVESEIKNQDIVEVGKAFYKEFSFKQEAYRRLEESLKLYVEGLETRPLMIFVDELDRVRPNHAVKYLEAIKHIFSVHGVCFVLAVDRTQLNVSIRQLYGQDIDFENYYRRFVTMEAELPSIQAESLMPFLEKKTEQFLDEKRANDIHFAFKSSDTMSVTRDISDTCKMFDFTAREIESFFRIFVHFLSVADQTLTAQTNWIKAAIVLIAIFVKDRDLYHRLGQDKVTPYEIKDYIEKLGYRDNTNSRAPEKHKRQLMLTCLAFLLKDESDKQSNTGRDAADIAKNLFDMKNGTPEDQAQEALSLLHHMVTAHGGIYHPETGFQTIYKNFESWKNFIER